MPKGVCHICWAFTDIRFCKLCEHWFCSGCRKKWSMRMFEAIKNVITQKDNCCGPRGKGK